MYQKGIISSEKTTKNMKNASQITTNQTNVSDFSKTRFVVLFVLLLLSSVGMFGQNVQPQQNNIIAAEDITVAAASATTANSSMNMVSWFMGTKQTPKATISNEGNDSSKKQMINAGIAPNRLLIKAFLKKASNYQSTIA